MEEDQVALCFGSSQFQMDRDLQLRRHYRHPAAAPNYHWTDRQNQLVHRARRVKFTVDDAAPEEQNALETGRLARRNSGLRYAFISVHHVAHTTWTTIRYQRLARHQPLGRIGLRPNGLIGCETRIRAQHPRWVHAIFTLDLHYATADVDAVATHNHRIACGEQTAQVRMVSFVGEAIAFAFRIRLVGMGSNAPVDAGAHDIDDLHWTKNPVQ